MRRRSCRSSLPDRRNSEHVHKEECVLQAEKDFPMLGARCPAFAEHLGDGVQGYVAGELTVRSISDRRRQYLQFGEALEVASVEGVNPIHPASEHRRNEVKVVDAKARYRIRANEREQPRHDVGRHRKEFNPRKRQELVDGAEGFHCGLWLRHPLWVRHRGEELR